VKIPGFSCSCYEEENTWAQNSKEIRHAEGTGERELMKTRSAGYEEDMAWRTLARC
jgi:hypothetical protein